MKAARESSGANLAATTLDKLNGLQTAVVPAWATILPIDCCCAQKAHACAELHSQEQE